MRSETLKYGSKGRDLPPYSDRGEQAVQQGYSEIAGGLVRSSRRVLETSYSAYSW